MGVLPRCPRSIATTFRVARRAEHGGKSIVHTAGLPRRLLAEFAGTALLVTVVVGSGIAAAQLSPDDVGSQLLENSTATVFGLAVLILMFGPVSGAHFNPVVTAADWLLGRRTGTGIDGRDASAYAAVQTAVVGAGWRT